MKKRLILLLITIAATTILESDTRLVFSLGRSQANGPWSQPRDFGATTSEGAEEALIVLSTENRAPMMESIDYLCTKGGRITHIYPTHILIGNLPKAISQQLVGQKGIEGIYYSIVDSSQFRKYGDVAVFAVEAWNNNFMGQASVKGLTPDPKAPQPAPIRGDVKIAPSLNKSKDLQAPGAPYGAGFYDTSEYMIGKISVVIILPESNGAIDRNQENWASSDISDVFSEIQAGLNWWAAREWKANLQFTYTLQVVATSYEPISHPQSDEYLWIGEVMSNIGYSSGDYFARVYSYLNDVRNRDRTDWAFAIFVANSWWDLDGMFADMKYFAYSYLGGPFMVMTYDNDGYLIWNMDAVTAHETGHIFYALDEYYDAKIPPTARSGYLNVENQNTEYGGSSNVACIMRGGVSAYWQGAVCYYTRGQIGWRDTDGDGILDIVDFEPDTALTPYSPDPTQDDTPTYTGSAYATATYPNMNPYGSRNRITINAITRVQYRISGGAWIDATPTDGTFNQVLEYFTFTPSPLTTGTYTFQVRALNSAGNWETSYASDVLMIDVTPPNPPSIGEGHCGPSWTTHNSPFFTWSDPGDSGSGVSYYEGSIDGGSVFTVSSGYHPTWGDGTHTFKVRAVDRVGNRGAWSNTITVKIDTQPPVNPTGWSGSHTTGVWSSNPVIYISWSGASDGGSGVYGYSFVWDNSPNTIPDTSVETTGTSTTSPTLPTGSAWYFHVRTVDNVGNWNTGAFHVGPFYIDTVAPNTPSLSESHCGSSWTAHNSPYYTWSNPGDSGSGVSYYQGSINDGTPFTVSSPHHPTWSDGIYAFKVRAVDGAGNIGAWSNIVTIKIDTTAPTGSISINSGATYTTSTSVTLTLSATDGSGSGVGYMCFSNDGSSWSSWYSFSTSQSWNLMSGDGTKTVYVQFKDNVGVVSSSYSDTIILDTTPPVGSISINGGAAYTRSTSVSLTLTYMDATSGVSQVRYSNDGVWDTEPWENPSGTRSWTLTTGDGTKTVYYQIRDNAGLTSACSATIILDTLAPSAPTLLSPSNGTIINTLTPTFSWQSSADPTSGVSSYTLQIDTSIDFTSTSLRTITGITSNSYTPTTPLTYATWNWHVKATDKAGNEGAFSAYRNIIIDRVRVTTTISISTTTSTTGTTYTSTTFFTTQRSTTNTTAATFSYTSSYTTTSTMYSGSTSTTYTATTTLFSTSTSLLANRFTSTSDSVGIVTRTSKTGTTTIIKTNSTSATSVETIYVRITIHSTFIEQFLETIISTLTRLVSELIQFVHDIFVMEIIQDTTVIVEPERGTCRFVLDVSPKPGYVNKPVNISGVTYGSWRCVRDGMVVGKPVTITASWGFSTIATTDYYGRFSVTTNCPSSAGTYQIAATFYEDQDLRGNSTSILCEITAKIPTSMTISYVANREFGGYLRRQDTGAYLAYKPVRLAVTYLSGSTWQTTSYDLQTRQDGYYSLEFLLYWRTATITFDGDETYASCSATLSRGGGSASGMSGLLSMAANDSMRAQIKASAIHSEAMSRIVLDASPKPGYINKPVNISGVMYGSWRCIRDGMVVGKPVEVVTGWGFSKVLTTDYYGLFSTITNCPSQGGTYPVTATFYEDQDLTASSTTISYEVVAKIPTTITISYVGNREFGGYLRRADTGAYLAYKPVKLTVTYLSGTTWRTDSFDLQTRQDGYWSLEFLFYWNSATVVFEGDETYASSSAAITR